MSTHESEDDARNADILIWVDGALKPRKDATVSVYDSGFLLGDGMWEGLRLYDGAWAFLERHLDRLFASCYAVGIDIGMDREGVKAALLETQRANGMSDGAHARLMVTRGIKDKPFQHPSLSRSGATLVIIMEHSTVKAEAVSRGAHLVTVPQVRGAPMAQDAKFNSHSKLNCVLACLQAERAGADEGLMLDPHGFVNTTNACNFFIVRQGAVWTSTGDYCMNGVTRQLVIDLCRENGIPVFERNFSLYDVHAADEAFLTGTFGAQTPVASIDGRVLGGWRGIGGKAGVGDRHSDGRSGDAGSGGVRGGDGGGDNVGGNARSEGTPSTLPGPVTSRIRALYRARVALDREQQLGGTGG